MARDKEMYCWMMWIARGERVFSGIVIIEVGIRLIAVMARMWELIVFHVSVCMITFERIIFLDQ